MRSRSEAQITAILEEHETGTSEPDLSRRHGMAENMRLRRLLPEAGLDKAALKELVEENW